MTIRLPEYESRCYHKTFRTVNGRSYERTSKIINKFFTRLAACQRVAANHFLPTPSDALSLIKFMFCIFYEEIFGFSLPCAWIQFSLDLPVFSSEKSFQSPSIYHSISLALLKTFVEISGECSGFAESNCGSHECRIPSFTVTYIVRP